MKNDNVIKRFREGFCMEEVWLCTCGHEAESHYWDGGGNPQCSGYDACRVEGCWCVYDEDKLELKQKYFENKPFEKFLLSEIKRAREEAVTGETSDGYHTFNELYQFRLLYNAALFNEWSLQNKHNVHKSKKHSDGEDCFGGGWFIVMANLPTGQISNHYELKDWDLFKCEEREKAEEWDGHTAKDVANRLLQALKEEL